MVTRSNSLAAPLRISLRRSLVLRVFLLFSHIGALVCLISSDLPAPLLAMGAVSLTISLGMGMGVAKYFRHGNPGTVTLFGCSLDGQWWLDLGEAEQQPVELLPGSYLHPLLVVLDFGLAAGGKKRLLLLPDMLGADEMRRLRVVVRAGAR